MHRPSAQSDPLAPLGHHWQDATHISFGVVTGGIYSRSWKIEGSAFNGREPDENRWNLDMRGLDSYSGRVTINPLREWSFSGWYGYLASPEELHPDESVHRYGVSALHDGRGFRGGRWSNALLAGVNAHGGHSEASFLVETNFEIGSRNSVFGRIESVRKSAEDLAVTDAGGSVYRSHGLGYVLRRGSQGHTWDPGLGYFVKRKSASVQWRGFRPSSILDADPADLPSRPAKERLPS